MPKIALSFALALALALAAPLHAQDTAQADVPLEGEAGQMVSIPEVTGFTAFLERFS